MSSIVPLLTVLWCKLLFGIPTFHFNTVLAPSCSVLLIQPTYLPNVPTREAHKCLVSYHQSGRPGRNLFMALNCSRHLGNESVMESLSHFQSAFHTNKSFNTFFYGFLHVEV